jgi:hypothetical protein
LRHKVLCENHGVFAADQSRWPLLVIAAEGGVMRVIRADMLEMSFGVRDALALIDGIGQPRAVTIHGQ